MGFCGRNGEDGFGLWCSDWSSVEMHGVVPFGSSLDVDIFPESFLERIAGFAGEGAKLLASFYEFGLFELAINALAIFRRARRRWRWSCSGDGERCGGFRTAFV
jgi:hypothetical protein